MTPSDRAVPLAVRTSRRAVLGGIVGIAAGTALSGCDADRTGPTGSTGSSTSTPHATGSAPTFDPGPRRWGNEIVPFAVLQSAVIVDPRQDPGSRALWLGGVDGFGEVTSTVVGENGAGAWRVMPPDRILPDIGVIDDDNLGTARGSVLAGYRLEPHTRHGTGERGVLLLAGPDLYGGLVPFYSDAGADNPHEQRRVYRGMHALQGTTGSIVVTNGGFRSIVEPSEGPDAFARTVVAPGNSRSWQRDQLGAVAVVDESLLAVTRVGSEKAAQIRARAVIRRVSDGTQVFAAEVPSDGSTGWIGGIGGIAVMVRQRADTVDVIPVDLHTHRPGATWLGIREPAAWHVAIGTDVDGGPLVVAGGPDSPMSSWTPHGTAVAAPDVLKDAAREVPLVHRGVIIWPTVDRRSMVLDRTGRELCPRLPGTPIVHQDELLIIQSWHDIGARNGFAVYSPAR